MNNILKTIFIFIVVLVSSFSIWMILLPSKYSVQHSIIIKAPVEVVFEAIQNHNNRKYWSTWYEADAQLNEMIHMGNKPIEHVYEWAGNNNVVGSGKITTKSQKLNEYINWQLEFTLPTAQTISQTIAFTSNNWETELTFTQSGKFTFFQRWLSKTIDKTLGAELLKNLQNIKAFTEKEFNQLQLSIDLETFGPKNIASQTKTFKPNEFEGYQSLEKEFEELSIYLEINQLKKQSNPFCIVESFDGNNLMVEACLPFSGSLQKMGNMPVSVISGNAISCTLNGSYQYINLAYKKLKEHLKANKIDGSITYIEEYYFSKNSQNKPTSTKVYALL